MSYPLKPIKKIIKNHHNGEISDEAVIYVKNILLDITELLALNAKNEFDELNTIRKKTGLKPLKRLEKNVLINVCNRFFKQINDKKSGKVGNNKTALHCQDGAKNRQK